MTFKHSLLLLRGNCEKTTMRNLRTDLLLILKLLVRRTEVPKYENVVSLGVLREVETAFC